MTVELHHVEAGQGLPLVLLHGFPLSAAMWTPQRRGLSDLCRVITPDQRGFGGSPPGDDPPSLETVADDIAALLDRLGLGRVLLGGLSMGGYVTMRFAARYPDRLAGIVLADTKATPDPADILARRERVAARVVEPGGAEVVARDLLPAMTGRTTKGRRPEVVDRIREMIAEAAPESVAWASRAMAARPGSLDVLAGLDVPALVIVGDEDEMTPLDDAQAMVEALPKGRLAVLPGVGHMSPMEDPREFNEVVRAFVTDLR